LLVVFLNFTAFPASAFLLPGSVATNPEGSSSSPSSLGTFLAGSSGSISEDRGQLGTSERKEDKVPKADVIITPSHPRLNDTIYAQAQPQNFRNSQSQLYYNWYIYNSDPKIGTVVIKNGEKVFIPSNTLEGALIRGAIAQVRGSYVPGVSPKAQDLGKANESTEQDRDGYQANYGGDNGAGAIEKKIDDILGSDYDFSYNDFTASCVQNCKVEYNNSKSESEWKYNKCAEPTCGDWIDSCCSGGKSDYDNCISKLWDNLQNSCLDKICDKKDKGRKEDCYRTLTVEDYSSCDASFFSQETSCVDDRNLYCLNKGSCGSKPTLDCVSCEKEYHQWLWDASKQKDYCEKRCEVKENNYLGSSSIEPVGSRCFRYNFGGRDSDNHMAGIFQPITCMHLFPGSQNPEDVANWDDIVPFKTGDGNFKNDEEIFWGTDPTNADTDGDGYPDEADVTGLGQQTIQYKYQSGDKVGVAVEGTSLFPTNEKTPYYKIMWAYSDICNSEVIRSADKNTPDFNNLCRCDDRKDGNCKNSKDYGFGYLKLNDIWQNMGEDTSNKLQVFISITPQRPEIHNSLILESIVSENDIDKDLLNYEWTLKHGGDVLVPENDLKNGRIIWKKQGVEVAYTQLTNTSADFKKIGGVGWSKLILEPILEGDYDAIVKVTQTQDTQQKMGETATHFNVSDNLKVSFYRTVFNNGVWEKRDEISNNEATPNERIIAEYEGPFYDDFVWYLDKKKLEGNSPRISLEVQKSPNSTYVFKLVASNHNRTNTTESETNLSVVNPYVSLHLRGETVEEANSNQNQASEKKNGLAYRVPYDTDLEFVALRNPIGSSFSVRDDLHYFWSFDEGESKEGADSYHVILDSKNYLVGTPHNLELKLYSPDKQLLAQDKVTLIPTKDNSTKLIGESRNGIAGLAFTFLNLPENIRFLLQTLVWVFLIYFLLSGIAWLAPIKANDR